MSELSNNLSHNRDDTSIAFNAQTESDSGRFVDTLKNRQHLVSPTSLLLLAAVCCIALVFGVLGFVFVITNTNDYVPASTFGAVVGGIEQLNNNFIALDNETAKIVFIVKLAVVTIVPQNTFQKIRYGQNDLPTPVSPPAFAFDTLTGNGICNITGYYKFEVATNALIQGIGTGQLQVILTITSGGPTRRFITTSLLTSFPGLSSAGNTLLATTQMNVGDVINVSIYHDNPATEVSFPQNQNILIGTLIQQ